jgi:hypothetical protein
VDYSKSEKWKEWTHTFQLDLLFEHLGELGKVDKMCINPIEVLLYPDKLKKKVRWITFKLLLGVGAKTEGKEICKAGSH